MECTCQKEFFQSSSSNTAVFSVSENTNVSEEYVVDFEQVPVGKQVSKKLKLRNESGDDRIFNFKRDPRTNPIYRCFELDKYEILISPNSVFELTITYLCTIPHKKNHDYFNIHVVNELTQRLTLKAESIGPVVNASITSLNFYNCSKCKKLKNIFELHNTSNVNASFQFDVNEGEQDVFVVKPIRGRIPANSHTFVEIAYVPKQVGQHFAKLPCLIEYHETIIIEAIGVYSLRESFDPEKLRFTRYPLPFEDTTGHSGYLNDSLRMRTNVPPVSLSENILDFGGFSVGAYNKMCSVSNCLTLVTSLTNHTDNQIEVKWEKDCDNVFIISPHTVKIPEKESVLFECHFYPNFEDQFYFKILTAQIVWMQTYSNSVYSDVFVPLLISLRLMGHSFPENMGWIPQIETPINVILPSTLPKYPTRNTFLLQSKGHLPVLFKFIPPKNSTFVVKPMIGIIRKYQVIVIQLQTATFKNSGCVELWQLVLNGQNDRRIQIYLKGQAEYPSVLIGNNNFIKFDCMHPGCQGIKREFFKNLVSYALSYDFAIDEHCNYLTMNYPSGTVKSNEVLPLDWYFLSSCNSPSKINVKCYLRAMKDDKETIGHPFETDVTIMSECSYSALCAIPKQHNFENLCFGSEVETSFWIFNFGESPLHFLLEYEKPENLKRSTVQINPLIGSIGHKEKRKIDVKLKAQDAGNYRIRILYFLRLNEISDTLINSDEGKQIFSFDFQCSWPILQITEILDCNFGPLFSKANLWKLLDIKEINHVLKNLAYHETKTISIAVPDMEINDLLRKTVILVRNCTNLDETVAIKKQQNCDCKAVPVTISLTRRKKIFKCSHRLMSKLYMDSEVVKANSSAILTLEITYLLPGITQACYLLTLSHKRTIMLQINIRGLPKSVGPLLPSIYTKSYEINFKNVYLGEKEPMAKGFWFYNNTDTATKYEVAVNVLQQTANEGQSSIICLNPNGLIPSQWALPLIFRFIPNSIDNIHIQVPVSFENEMIAIDIKAKASSCYLPIITTKKRIYEPILPFQSFTLRPQHVDIPFMTVWNYKEKMIFIMNQTENRNYSFKFQVAFVEGIVKVEAWPAKGYLKPGEIQAITLKITSFDMPCKMQLNLSCKFLDETQKAEHEASLQAYYHQQRLASDAITQNQAHRLDVESIIVSEPKFVYHTISISVRILSVCDRDLHLNVVQQKLLTPQIDIRLDNNDILQFLKHGRNDKTYERLHKKINLANIHHCESAIYDILKDVIYSSLFTNVVETLKNCPPPYYSQLKVVTQHARSVANLDEYIQKGTNDAEDIRNYMTENYLNRPQSYILAKVFQQLIFESVCEIFKLK